MKIILLGISKDKEDYLMQGIKDYVKRINKYVSFEYKMLPGLKKSSKMSINNIKQKEAEKFLSSFSKDTHIVLLDEKGNHYDSNEFSKKISGYMLSGKKNVAFLIGGAYGFDNSIYNRANEKIALSKMTFNHQLIRIIFLEQLYRAFTIINNEPYHNY